MKNICPKNECTGCGACAGVCPKDCITITGDEFGYLHPVIDNNICINCGLCHKTCPNNQKVKFTYPQNAFAAWAFDDEERESSTSGGVASVLARKIISDGGIVYGAVGSGAFCVEHQRIDSITNIDKFKKSKYVQSYISKDIFKKIKQDLKDGKTVLFTGTPCQTAAAKAISNGNEHLICVDIVCHGVPSQQILKDHIRMVVGNITDRITSFTTRDSKGYFITIYIGNNTVYRKPFPDDEYLNAFQYGLFNRPSCYNCKFAKPQRQSDLTIGDFWGLGKTKYPHHKVSVILVNSKRGLDLLEKVNSKLFLDERSVNEAIQGNAQLKAPSVKHASYDLFRKLYVADGYKIAIKRSLRKFYIKHRVYKFCTKFPGFNFIYAIKNRITK